MFCKDTRRNFIIVAYFGNDRICCVFGIVRFMIEILQNITF
ncbi:hypothetical protein [Campylobacter suis]|nr:hypothetical protein [Campylobacter suis]